MTGVTVPASYCPQINTRTGECTFGQFAGLQKKQKGTLGPSRTRGQNCLLMTKIRHHNEKPSATGLFPKGQNLVADGQTSKMPSTTSGAGQIETNLGKQKRGCLDSEMI